MEQKRAFQKSQRGVTLAELLVVVVVAAALMAISVPGFMQWRRTLQYRATAREIASSLRQAQTQAVTQNRQFRVQFEAPQFGRYRIQRADRMAAGGWINVTDWTPVPEGTTLGPVDLTPNDSVDFNPNGTSSGAATIGIYASQATPTHRFDVSVSSTGRIMVTKP